jgi:hypothetical protein
MFQPNTPGQLLSKKGILQANGTMKGGTMVTANLNQVPQVAHHP